MSKFISFLTSFVFIVLISACASKKSNTSNHDELSQKVIDRIEKKVVVSQEQKDEIIELAKNSGLSVENEKSEESKAKYKMLMDNIKENVLTDEQRTKLKKDKKKGKRKKQK